MKIVSTILAAFVLVLGMSAGAQARLHYYRHQGADPYTGTQQEACRLVGLGECPAFLRGRPIEDVCKPFWVYDGSRLLSLTFGKDQVDGPWIVELGARRLAFVCEMSTGLSFGRYNKNYDVRWGCGNYFTAYTNGLVLGPFGEQIQTPRPVSVPPVLAPPQQSAYSPPTVATTVEQYYPTSYPTVYGAGGYGYGSMRTRIQLNQVQGGAYANAEGGSAYSEAFGGHAFSGTPGGFSEAQAGSRGPMGFHGHGFEGHGFHHHFHQWHSGGYWHHYR